jgi:hypothetical protein
MNALELPEQLKGSWEHALILTYGLNIPFFERSLWHQFAACCRNKIILSDGQQYIQASKDYAQQQGLVRHMNQLYVVAGIFGLHAYTSMHAKLILLTNAQQGRLLVGSGNLHWQGYASGGELFTIYEFGPAAPEALPAFLAVRELVDALIQRGSIGITAHRRIEYMWEQTPWLFHTPANAERPVRHNLTSSFLDQLLAAVGGEPVEELWILSPFYDKKAVALERFLVEFQPGRTTILVQPGWTSADPAALQRVIDRAPGRCEIRSFQRESASAYVHAKCYVLKLKDRAICLQGSPNLSQVAMLLADPYSNVEVANLLMGPRNAFDYVFEALHIEPPVTDLTALRLDFQSTEEPEETMQQTWWITGGEWYGKRLLLNFQGTLPSLKGLALAIGESMFPLTVSKLELQSHLLELIVPEEAQGLLAQPLPIVILWEDGISTLQTNPIFVCNRAALDAALQHTAEHELLNHVGYLDLDDKEFEELLGELNETLIIDQQSVWQLAGRALPASTPDEEAGEHILYADINYDLLRQHPKIQQYMHSSTGSQGYTRSRLQIILNAITDHFHALGEGAAISAYMPTISAQLEESEDADEAEIPPAVEERQQGHWTTHQRIERLLKKFIQRYLQGLHSPRFQAFAGYEIVTQNYVIFTHVLWRLFAKDWVEEVFVIDALIQSWHFFWGDEAQAGYWYLIDPEQQAHALQLIVDYRNDAYMFAALFYSAKVASAQGQEKQMFALRAFWRKILCQPPFPLEERTLTDAQQMLAHLLPYDSPSATAIVNRLAQLARYDTRANFLHNLEVPGRYGSGSCAMEKHRVVRHRGQSGMVDCLVVQAPGALADRDEAMSLLQEWMESETLDYYRITTTGSNGDGSKTRLIFYDVPERSGKYWNKAQGGRGFDFEIVPLYERAWDASLHQLEVLADQIGG